MENLRIIPPGRPPPRFCRGYLRGLVVDRRISEPEARIRSSRPVSPDLVLGQGTLSLLTTVLIKYMIQTMASSRHD